MSPGAPRLVHEASKGLGRFLGYTGSCAHEGLRLMYIMSRITLYRTSVQ